jgi:hypothetical protein
MEHVVCESLLRLSRLLILLLNNGKEYAFDILQSVVIAKAQDFTLPWGYSCDPKYSVLPVAAA